MGWARWLRIGGANAREAGRGNEDAAVRRITELNASRRRIAEAFELERRRIERDLHDGAQQYFVAANLALGEARLGLAGAGSDGVGEGEHERALAAVAEAQELVRTGLKELRRIVHGISPRELEDLGLEAAVRDAALAFGDHVTVRCPHPLPRLDAAVAANAYFTVTEALTNAARYAPGAEVSVLLTVDSQLRITVVDAGPGGAEFRAGGGLAGLQERLAAVNGTLTLASPAGGPTTVGLTVPLLIDPGHPVIPVASATPEEDQ